MFSLRLGTFIDRRGVQIGAVIAFAGFAYTAVLCFLTVHTAALGIPEAGSAYFAAYALASLLARLLAGRI